MRRWFRTTSEVPLMSKTYVGEVFPRTVLFLNTGMAIAPGHEIPVGEPKTFPYGLESVEMLPVNLEGHPTLYIMGAFADKSSPHCLMERIKK